MDFKPHEEVVLPADEAARKRARDAARKQQPAPRIREVQIPASKPRSKAAPDPVSSASGERAVSRVPVREIQLSASGSSVGSSAASSTTEDSVESAAVETPSPSLMRENPAESAPVESAPPETAPAAGNPAVEPRILNAGFRLLSQASRQGSPGGRLVRSGRLTRRQAPVETATPREAETTKPAAEATKPSRAVTVESVGEMRFSKENVEEVATLQAPPPVDSAPEQKPLESRDVVQKKASAPTEPVRIDSKEFAQELDLQEPNPIKFQPKEVVQKKSSAQTEPLHFDSKEFAQELDLQEPNPIKIDSREVVQKKSSAQTEPLHFDSKEFARELDLPDPNPIKIDSREVVQKKSSAQTEPLHFDSKEFAQELDLPDPDPIEIDSEADTETIEIDPRELSGKPAVPEPEAVVVLELGQADLVWEPPESSSTDDDDPAKLATKASGKAKKGNPHQKPYRDFIIAYDGVFIGHFRSRKRITNRTAFQQVARQMHSNTSAFDVRKLQLYRPVPIEVEIPESLPGISDGAFMWFADRQSSSPDPG